MLFLINLPVKIVRLFDSNVSPDEVAAGVCLGMFFGFLPLNGPMAVVLFLCFFLFKINRLAAILVLPLFKLFYVLGVSALADKLGGLLLIDVGFLTRFWEIITGLPIIAYLDLNNTLVNGGIVVSAILTAPVYIGAKKGFVLLRDKYFVKIKNSAFVKWFKKVPIISKVLKLVGRLRSME